MDEIIRLVLWLCSRIGATVDDPRVALLIDFIKSQQNPYSLWIYASQPQVSRWVNYDLLASFQSMPHTGEWVSLEPPTPFKPELYGKQRRRQ